MMSQSAETDFRQGEEENTLSSSGAGIDSSIHVDGTDHNENKEGFASKMKSSVDSTSDSEMDPSVHSDGTDHYESREVEELSRGNKQYLMLVHTDNGDDDDIDEGLDSDEKLDDLLDLREDSGYTTKDPSFDIQSNPSSQTVDQTTANSASKENSAKTSDSELVTAEPDCDVFETSGKGDRRTGVSYTRAERETILGGARTQSGEITPPKRNSVDEGSSPEREAILSLKEEVMLNARQAIRTVSHHSNRHSLSRVFQSNSTDNLRNIGYRDSVSSAPRYRDSLSSVGSDISLPDYPPPVQGHYHKVIPLPNGDSDTEPCEHDQSESAKVERRKTWGSWEFRSLFSRNRETGVQRRSSFASRPVTKSVSQADMMSSRAMKKSMSQADIMCGECDYCVNLPQHNRLLQTQLDKTEKDFRKKEDDLASEIKVLKKENERQQKLIGQNLTLGPEAKIEATMQHEITRLTSENLDLRETIDKQTDQIRKLKKMLKVYSRKLKDGEGRMHRSLTISSSISLSPTSAAEIQAELEREENNRENGALATVKHRQRIYLGMLEYRREDEGALLKNLVLDLKPKIAAGLLPGLPAYIMFMCVRHTDYANDDEKVRSLLTGAINSIKKVVKKHPDDVERYTLWLANTCRILHTLKQYSGEKTFQAENTGKQNEQCLRNFDLSDYRQVFSDLAVWIYQGLIKVMQENVQPNIVPAVLEHEAIAGLTASKPSGLRGRTTSNAHDLDEEKAYSLDSLMRALNTFMKTVTQHAVDPELVKQIFRQLFYFICAGALNNLLLRKDMCNWSKGMQIRYNISHLEQWLRDNKLHESGAASTLETIIQASQLLQARKTDADVESVVEMCSKLTLAQIIKILNLYTPVDEFEERVPISFIRKIQEKLKHKQGPHNTLLMETKFSYPVTFPFNPSSIAMETIEVPDQLHLGFLKRI